MKKIILSIATMAFYAAYAYEGPIPIGNFALPTALQPSPLFSFGQNILDAHDALAYINPVYLKGKNKKSFTNLLYFIYGLTDSTSIFALVPVPTINKENGQQMSGFGDVIIQGEYAYINSSTPTTLTQATIVGSIYLPSGEFEIEKQLPALPDHLPFLGSGSTSFFLGGTFDHTTINWYSFASAGGFFTRTRKNNKIGNNFLYQLGLGRNISHLNDQILLLLFEFDGIYIKRNILMGQKDINSGGNVIYFGPVLYYANKWLIFQAGIQAPIYQKLNGTQQKNSYTFSMSVAWFFNR